MRTSSKSTTQTSSLMHENRKFLGNLPFHLSICVNDIEKARYFYTNILGLEERRSSNTSVHFDFYGCQLTCHQVAGYNAKNRQIEVDAEDVPVPHFGVALPYEEFQRLVDKIVANNVKFILKPHIRFVKKKHEQHVMFIEDCSGNGIELKSFCKAPCNTWA